jgi:hypothetical protein
MRVLSFLLVAIILFGCSEKEQKISTEKTTTPQQVVAVKKLSIQKVGELRFRKSYSGSSPDNESDNPWLYDKVDSSILKRFQELGLVNQTSQLLFKKFKSFKKIDYDHLNAEFEIFDSINKKLYCKLIRREDNTYYDLLITNSFDSVKLKVDGFYVNADALKFMLLDVINGGYQEIVILSDYYIINGDNSDIFIYEINYK